MRILLLLLALEGCVYSRANLHQGKDGYKNYPTSIEAEQQRRRTRRKHALIAAPIEIVGGLAITAAALYAKSQPSDAMSVGGQLSDAGKEVLGRLVAAAAGIALAGSGIGDGILGVIDPAFRSPIVRRGRLIPESEIDAIAPQRGPRFGFHATSVLGSEAVGTDLGFGLAHWVTPNVRLRHSATAEFGLLWGGDRDRRLLVSGETLVERAFGREAAGLYPKRSIGMYLGGGWSFVENATDLPVLRAGLSLGLRWTSIRLGTTYAPGDKLPSIELGTRIELRVD
jgi:hypothetical protein